MASTARKCLQLSGKLVGRIGAYSAILYCTAHCITEYALDFTKCTGPSMQPTIENNDIVLTEHISTKFFNKVDKGDVVVLRSPVDPKQFLCKRVVGMEFDEVPVNRWKFLRTKNVPKGHIWIEGDNRTNSTDSREFGPVPLAMVRGRAVLRVWPWERRGYLAPHPASR
ncbi:mitochondrial inner membrane protease subunit 1-like isoform X1 [Acanthaster planci]|uniref:Mitochondrial inner membrane protease subunit n=1 Tax=Acanthaster planci TaxID=133434 RepID=A0A8B7ZN78_ACAPL|nr:mitochondrial inner membrane protease subunit 1-like isoform X1 [Acanthaster planci]XP_022106350.1 mitochondrial inner membrane protease subunit 1-like isoform X1 [Acanthaster planci]XP_022106351.1 mitochondrial inner membrane protease subunit 1-like isoform X1 [Acanthaster planci]